MKYEYQVVFQFRDGFAVEVGKRLTELENATDLYHLACRVAETEMARPRNVLLLRRPLEDWQTIESHDVPPKP